MKNSCLLWHYQSPPPHRYRKTKIDCLRFVMCPLLAPIFQGFFFLFLMRPLTVLMIQTRQAICTIHQSILLRCLCPLPLSDTTLGLVTILYFLLVYVFTRCLLTVKMGTLIDFACLPCQPALSACLVRLPYLYLLLALLLGWSGLFLDIYGISSSWFLLTLAWQLNEVNPWISMQLLASIKSCFNKVGYLLVCKQSKRGWEPQFLYSCFAMSQLYETKIPNLWI